MGRHRQNNNNINTEPYGLNHKNSNCKLYYDKQGSPLASLTKRPFLDSPVQFKRYYMSDKLLSFTEQVACIKENKPFLHKRLDYFYEIFGRNKNLKKLILKEIKENLIS